MFEFKLNFFLKKCKRLKQKSNCALLLVFPA
jgi:hypothetical protein